MATGKIWTAAQNAAGELGGCKDKASVKMVGLEINWGNPQKGGSKSHKFAQYNEGTIHTSNKLT